MMLPGFRLSQAKLPRKPIMWGWPQDAVGVHDELVYVLAFVRVVGGNGWVCLRNQSVAVPWATS